MYPFKSIFVLFSLLVFSFESAAVDVIPGRAIAPPPGLNSIMATSFHSHLGDQYIDGNAQNLGSAIDIYNLQLRYSRTFLLNDSPAGFYIQPSFGTIRPSGALNTHSSSSGQGDTALALAYWPYVDRQAEKYFVLSGYLALPTGEYDSDHLLNLSQNRYSAAAQLGFQLPLNDEWAGMITGDFQWFGENDEFRLTKQKQTQDPLYSVQASLMHSISNILMLSASYYFQNGGETELDGMEQDDRILKHRYQLALTVRYDFGNLYFQLGGDIDTQNGFKEARQAILRYEYIWKD